MSTAYLIIFGLTLFKLKGIVLFRADIFFFVQSNNSYDYMRARIRISIPIGRRER